MPLLLLFYFFSHVNGHMTPLNTLRGFSVVAILEELSFINKKYNSRSDMGLKFIMWTNITELLLCNKRRFYI